ncbi:MAG: hypothetical protein ACRD5D_07920 [Candidatus Polarisedimenticolia bacterium]
MKKILAVASILIVAGMLSSEAMAGHRDHDRGRHRHSHPWLKERRCYVVHRSYRPRPIVSFGFHAGPAYVEPVPVFVGPPVWVPGHDATRNGVRFYIQGYWSR